MSSLPLISSLVKNRLFKTVPVQDRHRWATVSVHPHYGFVCGRHDALWQSMSRSPQNWDLGCLKKVWRFFDAAVQLLHVRGAVCRCTVLLEQSRYQTLRIAGSSMMSLWRHKAATKKSVRDITRISYFVTTMKFTACIADLFNSFCEEAYAVAFFKAVQQQTIREVGKSIICL